MKASTDKRKATNVFNNLTIIETTTEFDVLNVPQREYQEDEAGCVDTDDDPSFYGDQKRRRQSDFRGRVHQVASRLLARALATDGSTVLRRRRHSTPTPIEDQTSNLVQKAEREQNNGQSRKSRPSRRKSLLSRARSLRGAKSMSDLKTIARRRELKGQRGSPPSEEQDQAGGRTECAVVRMRSINSARSAPLYFSRASE